MAVSFFYGWLILLFLSVKASQYVVCVGPEKRARSGSRCVKLPRILMFPKVQPNRPLIEKRKVRIIQMIKT